MAWKIGGSGIGLAFVLTFGAAVGIAHAQNPTGHVVLAATFPGSGDGDIAPQTTFPPDVPKITFGVKIRDLQPGDKITAAWIAEKTDGAPAGYEISITDMTAGKDAEEVLAFRLSKPTAGWPKGDYRIDVSYNGKLEMSQHFSVADPS